MQRTMELSAGTLKIADTPRVCWSTLNGKGKDGEVFNGHKDKPRNLPTGALRCPL